MKMELEKLEQDIEEWGNLLNKKGIWLFLATLGCLGIPDSLSSLRITAFAITIGMFLWYLFSSVEVQRVSFPKRFKLLSLKIWNEIENKNQQKELLDDLERINIKNKSFKNMLNASPYIAGVLFWWISFNSYYQVWLKEFFTSLVVTL